MHPPVLSFHTRTQKSTWAPSLPDANDRDTYSHFTMKPKGRKKCWIGLFSTPVQNWVGFRIASGKSSRGMPGGCTNCAPKRDGEDPDYMGLRSPDAGGRAASLVPPYFTEPPSAAGPQTRRSLVPVLPYRRLQGRTGTCQCAIRCNGCRTWWPMGTSRSRDRMIVERRDASRLPAGDLDGVVVARAPARLGH